MNTFSATNNSEAVVPAPRAAIWTLLTDPEALTRMTPLLAHIDVDGEYWRWHLTKIAALGVNISPIFTERMSFNEPNRIDYAHEPPSGVRERTGVEGHYELREVEGGTHLAISLTIRAELPLPKIASAAATKVISSTMERTGKKFASNLMQELGVSAAS